ncbi:NGG1p interacting factor NIF3, partial [Candidatus Curtissbacteria bacterium]|nr:NGG1p interacting factor NIF3 [Candidatus Curtissbacteria bacterium]
MTLQEIYDLAVEMGIKADPRGVEKVKRYLEKTKKRYSELSEKKKKYFDKETFTNPYTDTRIFFGDPKTKIKKILAGIDADASEILLADRLNQKGEGIDVVISHHPHGHSLASLYEVMDLQIDMFEEAGVPVNVAHALFQDRISQVQRKLAAVNHNQSVDTARLLGIPLMSLHTVWDNLGNNFMQKY